MFQWVLLCLNRWRVSAEGSVGVIFLLVLLAMLAAAGLSIDYLSATQRRAKLDAAADLAVLAAVKQSKDAALNGLQEWRTAGEELGLRLFSQNVGPGIDVSESAITLSRNGNEFTGTLNYAAVYRTGLMSIFDQEKVVLRNKVTASYSAPTYLDVHLLIDASPRRLPMAGTGIVPMTASRSLFCSAMVSRTAATSRTRRRRRISIPTSPSPCRTTSPASSGSSPWSGHLATL